MILQRYILRDLVATFVAAFVSLTAVIFVAMALVQLQALKYFPMSALGQLAPYFLPLTLAYALPIGILISCSLVFGRLSADNEIDAIRVAGIPLRRVLAPPLILGLVASAATVYLNEELVPQSHLAQRKITQRGIQEALYNLNRETTSIPIGKEVALGWRTRQGDAFEGFEVRRLDKESGVVQMEARAAEGRLYWDPSGTKLWVDLKDGVLLEYARPKQSGAKRTKESRDYRDNVDFNSMNPGKFDEYREVIDLTNLGGEYVSRVYDMTRAEIQKAIKKGGVGEYSPDRLRVELYKRRAGGFAPLVFALFGTPLGILMRKGSRLAGLGMSVLPVFVVYYPLMMTAEALAKGRKIGGMVGLWSPDVIMLVGAIVLLHLVLRK